MSLVDGVLRRFLGGLRFPWLFLVTTAVFLVDLAVPDVIPLVDEVLLGLLSLLLGSLRARKDDGAPEELPAPEKLPEG